MPTFNNGIDWAALLAVTAVDTLGHINIVSGGSAASVFTLFGFDGNSLGRADSFAELAGNTTLFTSRIAAQGVLSTETGGNRALFEGIEDSVTR